MKTAIKLVLLYFLMQILGGLTAVPLTMLYVYLVYGTFDADTISQFTIVPTMLISFVYMAWYLAKKGYLKNNGLRYACPSLPCMGWAVLAGASAIVLLMGLDDVLSFLPDWLEMTFDKLQDSWLGILCVALLGPVLEELLFRGAITDVLLRKYTPVGAVLLSGLIFGVFHINPAQVVGACLIGFLLGWMYWRTRSLWPGIIIHVLNNSLGMALGILYPDVETMADIPGMGGAVMPVVLVVAAALLALSVWRFHKITCKYNKTYI